LKIDELFDYLLPVRHLSISFDSKNRVQLAISPAKM